MRLLAYAARRRLAPDTEDIVTVLIANSCAGAGTRSETDSYTVVKIGDIDIELHNPFPQDVMFNVQIVYEKNQRAQKPKKEAQPAGRGQV